MKRLTTASSTIRNLNVHTMTSFVLGSLIDPRYYEQYERIPCALNKNMLGFQYGVFADWFYQSPHVPTCLPQRNQSTTTYKDLRIGHSIHKFVAKYYPTTDKDKQEANETTITKQT